MLCFLSTLEGWFLGAMLLLSFIVIGQKSRIKKLSAKLNGSAPLHPQDRLRAKRMTGRKVAAESKSAESAPRTAPAQPPAADVINPLDWLVQPADTPVWKKAAVPTEPDHVPAFGEPELVIEPVQPEPQRSWIDRLMGRYAPHIKPFLFALSVVGVWFLLAWYYNYLNHYTPPEGEEIGDFRILYLKKFVGGLLPMISSVGSALGLLFMLNPRYYIYLNGWLLTDYDFYTDLRNLHKPDCYRRVLVFCALFGLFLLVSLWVLLHSSPQELTL